MATVVAILTSMVVANATQTITTPNAAFISYSLAPHASSAAITPATNRSVLVMGCCTTNGDLGVGQVSLLHIPSTAIDWVGLDSWNGGTTTTTTAGSTGTAGAHIVWIDGVHSVDITVASADTIHVLNRSNVSTLAGNLTLVW